MESWSVDSSLEISNWILLSFRQMECKSLLFEFTLHLSEKYAIHYNSSGDQEYCCRYSETCHIFSSQNLKWSDENFQTLRLQDLTTEPSSIHALLSGLRSTQHFIWLKCRLFSDEWWQNTNTTEQKFTALCYILTCLKSYMLSVEKWRHNQATILHMPRQLCCRDMCKFVAWLAHHILTNYNRDCTDNKHLIAPWTHTSI